MLLSILQANIGKMWYSVFFSIYITQHVVHKGFFLSVIRFHYN